ncbi:MAG: ATP synthase F1 subunit delta [Lachnospiraceae bacterium]|nr:ATP synthase F1 subunit delta [Lachnospiraceae bacterium]
MSDLTRSYGDALYDLAQSEDLADVILSDLQEVCALFSETPAYPKLLSEPSLPKQERTELIRTALSGSVHLYTLNFLRILTEKGLIRNLSDCAECFRERYNEDRGIVEAKAVSAVKLSDLQREQLIRKLRDITGKKITLKEETDLTLLGGIRLSLMNREFDGTVRGRIEDLSRILRETTL